MNFLKRYKVFEKISLAMEFWHGGILEESYDKKTQKRGRYESGPGLYLTTHYETARKYAKGGRKMYKVTIEEGTDLNDVKISIDDVKRFVSNNVVSRKRKDVNKSLDLHNRGGFVKAYILNNSLINNDALRPSRTGELVQFFLEQGIDYQIVENAFVWGERVLVLYNMKKLINKTIIRFGDKIETFDLPTDFS